MSQVLSEFGKLIGTSANNIQVAVMPQASTVDVGTIVQYIGATNANYTNGYFYKCISDGGDPATYSWSSINVQPQPTIDISGKADKVSGATSGNFAALDSSGNLTDSGSKASDFLTQHQDISGKADKPATATTGNFASFDANKNPVDSGKKASDFVLTSAVGTAAAKNVPASGNASTTEVVMGNDTRLSNARSANGGIADSMRSLNSAGQSHGNNWLLTDKHNVNGDGYFYLYTGDDSVKTSVYKANIVPAAGVQAGQFPGWTVATPSDATTRQIRNIGALDWDPTPGVTQMVTGEIYLVYE